MKKAIILSGISGSGKSKYAVDYMRYQYPSVVEPVELFESLGMGAGRIVSADSHFLNDNGEYLFKPEELTLAHSECFAAYLFHLLNGNGSDVIVDNTNLSEIEIAPYMLAATTFGYEPEVRTFVCESGQQVKECAARNSHGLPLSAVERQWKKLSYRKLAPWWKNTDIAVTF
jgi:hypothetical protein